MLFRVSPQVIAGIHLVWIGLIIAGTGYVLINPAYTPLHLILISSGLLVLLVLGFCPLTQLEEKLRKKHRPDFSYENSFTTFHFNKVFKTSLPISKVNRLIILVHVLSYAISVLTLVFR